jgi:hypothetical protein
MVYPGYPFLSKEGSEATQVESLNDFTANDSPTKLNSSKLPHTFFNLQSRGPALKGSGVFHAETIVELTQNSPSHDSGGREKRPGFSSSFRHGKYPSESKISVPSEPPVFLFESCKGIPIPTDLPGPNDLELSSDLSGNCNVYKEFGKNRAFNQAFDLVYAV